MGWLSYFGCILNGIQILYLNAELFSKFERKEKKKTLNELLQAHKEHAYYLLRPPLEQHSTELLSL